MVSRLEHLQRLIIVHSILYYQMDSEIVFDHQFDSWCQELCSLKDTEEFKQSKFYNIFQDFDGSTGMHLPKAVEKDTYWIWLANHIYRLNNLNKGIE